MRRVSFALSTVFLIAVHVQAAESGSPSAAPKSQTAAPPKTAPTAPLAPPARPDAVPTQTAPATAPRAGDAPPAEFYVEPPSAGGPSNAPPEPPATVPEPPGPPSPPPSEVRIYDPPPPGFYPENEGVFEPQPPPEPRHVAPRTALWLGARVGWFIPFGNVWARGVSDGQNLVLKGVPWSDYASSGPMFELDAGARLSRNYNVFALWERAQLGSGSGDPNGTISGKSAHGDSDFWGVGIRASSDPDGVGFVTELAVGYRRARSKWSDGSELQLTDAPFEARLGLGADIRVNRFFSLSPMFNLGVGSFGKVESVSNHTVTDETGKYDEADGHAWASLTLGGGFDLLGSRH